MNTSCLIPFTRLIPNRPEDLFPSSIKTGVLGFLLGLFVFIHLDSSAQNSQPNSLNVDSFDIHKASFLLPQPHPPSKYAHAIFINYVVVPKDWTLEAIRAPMFGYEGKYALPHGFTLQGSLSTLFISTRINMGPTWNYGKGPWYVGVGYQVAFNYGILKEFGFNSKLVIWEQQPSLTLGYSFSKTALVFRGDLYWTTAVDQYQGGHKISNTNSFINGYGVGARFEQRLWGNKLSFFGVKANYLLYHIIAWPAFPVNQYRYWVPEIQIGLVL